MQEEKLDKILAKVVDMDEKMNDFVTKDHLDGRIDGLQTSVDGFVKLHETLDQEIASLRHGHARLEERLTLLEQKVGA